MNEQWQDICEIADIPPMSAVCALHQGQQVAIFNLSLLGEIKSISNHDPIANANVLPRSNPAKARLHLQLGHGC